MADALFEFNPHLLINTQVPGPKTNAGSPGSVLARFLELRGRRIVQACGALWHTVPGRFLMSLPYHAMLNPDPTELRQMIREAGVVGARFPSLSWTGLDSGIYVLGKCAYDIGSLHTKHRPRVRHALRCFEVRLAGKNELLEQGRALNLSTMARQGRFDPEFGDRRMWTRFVEAALACPEVAFPAAFCGSRMAAYMTTCRDYNCLNILHQMSRQEDLPNFPNHLLTYAVSREATLDPSVETISYGFRPLFSADGLHEYKLRFGYEVLPHRSAIRLYPGLNTVLNHSAMRAAVRLARRWQRGSQELERFETVLEGARLSRPPINA